MTRANAETNVTPSRAEPGAPAVDVSVIVPVYNKAPYLAGCLESVLNQTLSSLEVICVDDGSSDGSGEILESYAAKDTRVRIIRHDRNRGAASARNAGFAAARGEFVQFTDADDLLPADALARLLHRARTDRVDAVRGGLTKFSAEVGDLDASEIPIALSRVKPMDHAMFWVPWWHTTYLFSRRFLQTSNIQYPALCDGEDPVFLAHVLTRVTRVSTVSDVTYHYRLGVGEKSARRTFRHLRDYLRHIDAVKHLFLDAHPEAWQSGLAPFMRPQIEAMVHRMSLGADERRLATSEMDRIFDRPTADGREGGCRRLLYMYNVCGPGGVEASIANKMEALRPHGVEVRALFQSVWGQGLKFDPTRPGFVVEPNENARRQFILDWNPDAVVIVDAPWLIDTVGMTGVRRPVLFESHLSERAALDWRVRPALSDLRVSAFLTPSQFNRGLLERLGAESSRVRVIPNAVAPTFFRPALGADIRPGLGLPAERRLLLFVGRLEPAKDPLAFVNICAALVKHDPRFHAVVVGGAVDTAEYAAGVRAAAMHALGEHISFIERLAYHDMALLYNAVAASRGCLVVTSLNESQPMVVLEAMACRCPVVASDVDGLKEMIDNGRTGFLYPVGSWQAAVQAICRVTDDLEHRQAVVEAASNFVAVSHSPEATARAYVAVLESVSRSDPLEAPSATGSTCGPGAGNDAERFVPLAERIGGLLSGGLVEHSDVNVEPGRELCPGVRLSFEQPATVHLSWQSQGDVGPGPDATKRTLHMTYTGQSRWLTVGADVSWEELTRARRYRYDLHGRANRDLHCRVVLRIPRGGEDFADFRMCEMVLSAEGPSAHGAGWLERPDVREAQQERLPQVLLFLDVDADLDLQLERLTASFE